MSPERLRELCENDSIGPADFAIEMSALSDTQRTKLSKPTQDLFREFRADEAGVGGEPTNRSAKSRLAILACCPWSVAKRVRGDHWRLFPNRTEQWADAVVAILLHRRPDWTDRWIQQTLDADNVIVHWLTWAHLRSLIDSGVIDRPESDGYIRLFAIAFAPREGVELDDRFIEYEFWRMLDVETGALGWLPEKRHIDLDAWAKHSWEPHRQQSGAWIGGGNWYRAIYHYVATGRIDRGRLLKTLVDSAWSGLNQQILSAYYRFYGLFQTTEQDVIELQPNLIALLQCGYGPAITLAIRELRRIEKSKQFNKTLNADEIIATIEAVFSISSKTQPKAALALIDRIVTRHPQLAGAAVEPLAIAINHPAAEIQEQAITMLAKWKRSDASLDLSDLPNRAVMTGPVALNALNQLVHRFNERSSIYTPLGGLFRSLLDVDRAWTDVANDAVIMGLVCRDENVRSICIDAMIDGITDGRADITDLGTSLLQLASLSWIKPNRLASGLDEISRTGTLAQLFVANLLDNWIATWDSLPRDAHHVLELRLHTAIEADHPISDPARNCLEKLTGTGKAAKLSQSLSQNARSTLQQVPHITAVMEAVRGQLARVQRWQDSATDVSTCETR